ncbi:twin-arginine translocation signal domain-containing protein [Dolichospermum sp. ST_sed1]|nr:twin-arginine translocation signal domain-containing protein [Dolichospermum sp. ST_sed1]MDD1425570.1 twin-arginine translocation signal domain-containing protein [Dolichospermum sp. ST_sed9]MDD1432209.1 twin-arginine translocation signal domain-containing protein [Dolichospermum sp. ST_sed6]MDD1436039.1 twin-arginine translocation signal domain-containing protein [Dolichospermum sp. ST_sed10]MDD1441916.1 twin-arginine translocation signal domain-containing protein [Dolichospermum sp. ST_sed
MKIHISQRLKRRQFLLQAAMTTGTMITTNLWSKLAVAQTPAFIRIPGKW